MRVFGSGDFSSHTVLLKPERSNHTFMSVACSHPSCSGWAAVGSVPPLCRTHLASAPPPPRPPPRHQPNVNAGAQVPRAMQCDIGNPCEAERVSAQAALTRCANIESIPLRVSLEVESAGNQRLAMCTVSAPDVQRLPSDIVLVVDTSGSMGSRATAEGAEASSLTLLDIVKHAIKTVLATLNESDRVSLISFDNSASVRARLTTVDEEGRRLVQGKVDALNDGGGTNLWAGLLMGMEVLSQQQQLDAASGQPQRARNSAILLLTDGDSPTEPDGGHLPCLKLYSELHGGKYPGTISTFGFGYSLDSQLLRQLAVEGGGAYSFIPDSGFVGTVFVNALANTLVTVANQAQLSLELDNGATFVATDDVVNPGKLAMTTSWGQSIMLSSVQAEQPLRVLMRLNVPENCDGDVVSATLTYVPSQGLPVDNKSTVKISAEQVVLNDPIELQAQQWRLRTINCIDGIMKLLLQGTSDALLAQCKALIDALVAPMQQWADLHPVAAGASHSSAQKRVQGLLADLKGQVTEACSRADWVAKWGRHYLPSLQRAHELCQQNNFKDPGVQCYGGAGFAAMRDTANDIFDALPAPVPCVNSYYDDYNYGGYGGAPSRAAGAPTSMRSFNCASAGCVHANAMLTVLDATNTSHLRVASEVRAGDRVLTSAGEHGVVKCVLRTDCVDGGSMMCRVPTEEGQLLITPWHPVMYNGKWTFPHDINSPAPVDCLSVFSFLIESVANSSQWVPTVWVDGVSAVTLAHGIQNDTVASHSFWGTDQVVKALQQCSGWQRGLVRFSDSQSWLLRDSITGLGSGFDTACEINEF